MAENGKFSRAHFFGALTLLVGCQEQISTPITLKGSLLGTRPTLK